MVWFLIEQLKYNLRKKSIFLRKKGRGAEQLMFQYKYVYLWLMECSIEKQFAEEE